MHLSASLIVALHNSRTADLSEAAARARLVARSRTDAPQPTDGLAHVGSAYRLPKGSWIYARRESS
jgi:hypothetical protein